MKLDPGQRKALRRFVEAVHAFASDPEPANLARYLAASRALDEPKRRQPAGGVRRSRAAR